MFWKTVGDSFSMSCFLPTKSQTSSYVFNLSQLSPLLPQEIPKARFHFTMALSDHIWLTIYWPGFPLVSATKNPSDFAPPFCMVLREVVDHFKTGSVGKDSWNMSFISKMANLSIVHWSGWLSKKAAPVFMILFSPSVGWCRRLRTNFVFTISLNSCTLYKAAFRSFRANEVKLWLLLATRECFGNLANSCVSNSFPSLYVPHKLATKNLGNSHFKLNFKRLYLGNGVTLSLASLDLLWLGSTGYMKSSSESSSTPPSSASISKANWYLIKPPMPPKPLTNWLPSCDLSEINSSLVPKFL